MRMRYIHQAQWISRHSLQLLQVYNQPNQQIFILEKLNELNINIIIVIFWHSIEGKEGRKKGRKGRAIKSLGFSFPIQRLPKKLVTSWFYCPLRLTAFDLLVVKILAAHLFFWFGVSALIETLHRRLLVLSLSLSPSHLYYYLIIFWVGQFSYSWIMTTSANNNI